MNRRPDPDPDSRPKRVRIGLVIAVIVGLAAIALRLEGHRWWCRCGRFAPWSRDIHSEHNSQHFVDPYSFTHVEHGLILYALLWPFAGRLRPGCRLILAVSIEALWEVVENSPAVIERYRQATISLGYYGDSVANSVGDIAACASACSSRADCLSGGRSCFSSRSKQPCWRSTATILRSTC